MVKFIKTNGNLFGKSFQDETASVNFCLYNGEHGATDGQALIKSLMLMVETG